MLSLGKLAAVLAVAMSAFSVATPVAADDLTRTEVTVQSGHLKLRGMIYASAAGPARKPGMVLVHGAGSRAHEDLQEQAEAFARGGVVVLAHDKRTEGYSVTRRSFSELADDTLAAVGLLRAQPGVDPERVGVWGFSEGGWVAPLAASRSRDVKFLVTVGAGGHSPERVQVWSNANYLAHAGVTGHRLQPLAVGFTRLMIATGLYGEGGYDPRPALRRVHQPVLAIWGAHERSIPPAESARLFQETLEAAGNTRLTIRFLPGADHELLRSPDGFENDGRLVAGYDELVTSWIHRLGERHEPSSGSSCSFSRWSPSRPRWPSCSGCAVSGSPCARSCWRRAAFCWSRGRSTGGCCFPDGQKVRGRWFPDSQKVAPRDGSRGDLAGYYRRFLFILQKSRSHLPLRLHHLQYLPCDQRHLQRALVLAVAAQSLVAATTEAGATAVLAEAEKGIVSGTTSAVATMAPAARACLSMSDSLSVGMIGPRGAGAFQGKAPEGARTQGIRTVSVRLPSASKASREPDYHCFDCVLTRPIRRRDGRAKYQESVDLPAWESVVLPNPAEVSGWGRTRAGPPAACRW